MLVIAFIGWGVAATGYAHAQRTWNPNDHRAVGDVRVGGRVGGVMMILAAFIDFCFNSVAQIPSVFSVAAFTFSNRLWLPILIAVAEVGAAFAGMRLARFEQELNRKPRRR